MLNAVKDEVKYIRELNVYDVDNGKFFVILSEKENIQQSIDMLAIHNLNGNKVIMVNGEIEEYNIAKATELHIEIIDNKTVKEIKDNIEYRDRGINIPAIGYGALKMHIILKIKNSKTKR